MTRKLKFSFTIKVWDCDKWQISYHNTILSAFNCKVRGKWGLLCLGCWGNEAHEIIHMKYLAQWLKNWRIIWTQLMPAAIIPPKNVLLISRLKYATANYSVRSLEDLKIDRCYRELIIFPPPWYLTLNMAIHFTQFTSDQTVSSDFSFNISYPITALDFCKAGVRSQIWPMANASFSYSVLGFFALLC